MVTLLTKIKKYQRQYAAKDRKIKELEVKVENLYFALGIALNIIDVLLSGKIITATKKELIIILEDCNKLLRTK